MVYAQSQAVKVTRSSFSLFSLSLSDAITPREMIEIKFHRFNRRYFIITQVSITLRLEEACAFCFSCCLHMIDTTRPANLIKQTCSAIEHSVIAHTRIHFMLINLFACCISLPGYLC